jgi:putative nucleotidyltransferase with HDIG domain
VQAAHGETAASIRDTATVSTTVQRSRPLMSAGRLYVSLVIVLGTVVLVDSVGRLYHAPPPTDWWLLLGLTILSGTAVLRIPSTDINFSISDVFTLTSAVVFGPAAGVVTVTVDCLAISHRLARKRLPVERVLFNAAAPPLAMWFAAHLFFVISRLQVGTNPTTVEEIAPALLCAAGAYFLLNTFAVALAIALHERASVIMIWKAHCGNLWASFLGGAVGAGFVVSALQHGYGAMVLGLPLLLALILHFAYRNATGRVEDQLQHLAEVNRLHLSTVESLAYAIDAKDSVTHNHIRRVQQCALVLARRIGLTDQPQLKALEAAALLHDIGKLAVPEHILNKPGKLTPAEFERMKTHAAVGAEILSQVAFPYPVVPIVRHHHENWDGTGYPDGLQGTDIPIGARILSVIDCYDALTSDRPYRRALAPTAAFEIIRARRGVMYDPLLVDTFEEIYLTLETEADAKPASWAAAEVARAAARPEISRPVARADDDLVRVAFDLGGALSTAPQEQLGHILWEQVQRVAGVDSLAIYRTRQGLDRLAAFHAAGAAADLAWRMNIEVGDRLSGWVAANGNAMVNADPALDFEGAAPELRSALVVRETHGDTTVVIALYSRAAQAFDDRMLGFVTAIAPAIAARVAAAPTPAPFR